jgi:hypothetical protein
MLELSNPIEPAVEVPAETPPPDPYGGVALGVECAWPLELRGETGALHL